MERLVTVEGYGRLSVTPDVIRLEVTVEGCFDTYEEAYEQANKNCQLIGQILVDNKQDAKVARIIRNVISDLFKEEESYDDDSTWTIRQGSALVQKFIIDLDIDPIPLNEIIRGIGKFIKQSHIDIGFTIRDPHPYQIKVIEMAVKDAKKKAAIMAKAAGYELNGLFDMKYRQTNVELYSHARIIHSNAEAMACDINTFDITPDDLILSDTVKVSWDFIDPSIPIGYR